MLLLRLPSPLLRQWQCQERTLFVNGQWRVEKHQCRRKAAAAIQQLFTRVLLPHNYIMRVLETSRREKRRAMDGGVKRTTRVKEATTDNFSSGIRSCPAVRLSGWTKGPIFQRKLCDQLIFLGGNLGYRRLHRGQKHYHFSSPFLFLARTSNISH